MKIPKGWRFLYDNEIIESGDRYWSESRQKWMPTSDAGRTLTDEAWERLYIRKLSLKKKGRPACALHCFL